MPYRDTTVSGVVYSLPEYYSNPTHVGSGSYGSVCCVMDTRTGKQMAVKKVKWDPKAVLHCKMTLREVRLMIHFHMHDNLLNLVDIVMPLRPVYDALYLVSQYIKTDLNTLLAKHPAHFTAENTLSMVYSMLAGLYAMHSASVMHRDLKPSNILVDSDGTVKLADFGLGRDDPLPGDEATVYVVTRWYRAPEVQMHEKYDRRIDVWSLGCILGEMLAAGEGVPRHNQVLFPSKKQDSKGEQVVMLLDFLGHIPGKTDSWVKAEKTKEWLRKQPARGGADLHKRYPTAKPEALALLRSMLAWDPQKRLTVEECMQHRYLGEYAWEEGEMDQAWPRFDGMFAMLCREEDDAQRMANLEITRFHPEFAGIPGVATMDEISLRTSAESPERTLTDDMDLDADSTVWRCTDHE